MLRKYHISQLHVQNPVSSPRAEWGDSLAALAGAVLAGPQDCRSPYSHKDTQPQRIRIYFKAQFGGNVWSQQPKYWGKRSSSVKPEVSNAPATQSVLCSPTVGCQLELLAVPSFGKHLARNQKGTMRVSQTCRQPSGSNSQGDQDPALCKGVSPETSPQPLVPSSLPLLGTLQTSAKQCWGGSWGEMGEKKHKNDTEGAQPTLKAQKCGMQLRSSTAPGGSGILSHMSIEHPGAAVPLSQNDLCKWGKNPGCHLIAAHVAPGMVCANHKAYMDAFYLFPSAWWRVVGVREGASVPNLAFCPQEIWMKLRHSGSFRVSH